MVVAFVGKEQKESKMRKYCDVIVRDSGEQSVVESLIAFIEEYQGEKLLIPNNVELKIQLIQLLPVLEKAEECQMLLYFEDKGNFPYMNNQDYFQMLLMMARQEKEVMTNRSRAVVVELKEQGVFIGRPTITDEIIEKIRYMSHHQQKSIREIAATCQVSVGTVHKYTTDIKGV